ncbi:MAG: dihydroorotate dehydrogenase electron transfer subunit [Bacillota bacterium]
MPMLETATVVGQTRVARDTYRMELAAAGIAAASCPGQFVMVQAGHEGARLRRPLSLHRFDAGRVELLYRVVGSGTRWLAGLAPGEQLELLGPLGRGFPLHPDRPAVLVGGGIGGAPLVALAEARGRAEVPTLVLLGARQAAELVAVDRFRDLGCRVEVATDDGSAGRHGLVTQWLPEAMADFGEEAVIYGCGPQGMLRALMTLDPRFTVYLSLEERMACGVGACLGCAVAAADGGYLRVCRDGPVFAREEVRL